MIHLYSLWFVMIVAKEFMSKLQDLVAAYKLHANINHKVALESSECVFEQNLLPTSPDAFSGCYGNRYAFPIMLWGFTFQGPSLCLHTCLRTVIA